MNRVVGDPDPKLLTGSGSDKDREKIIPDPDSFGSETNLK
jgi:hypothetical protein